MKYFSEIIYLLYYIMTGGPHFYYLTLKPVTSDELEIIVNSSSPTNYDLDPFPTRLLK